MLTASNKFESELKRRLDQEMIRIAEILSAGQAVKDYPEYCKRVGEFQALKRVSEIYCDEVNTTINER